MLPSPLGGEGLGGRGLPCKCEPLTPDLSPPRGEGRELKGESMMLCPDCGQRLPADPDQYGARCPVCREPLYEQPASRRRGLEDDGRCPVHPDNAALGTCGRCGNYLCDTCRTRWRDRWLCAACVDLALERKEAMPAEASAHLRQALLALGLGVASWAIFLAAILIAAAAM